MHTCVCVCVGLCDSRLATNASTQHDKYRLHVCNMHRSFGAAQASVTAKKVTLSQTRVTYPLLWHNMLSNPRDRLVWSHDMLTNLSFAFNFACGPWLIFNALVASTYILTFNAVIMELAASIRVDKSCAWIDQQNLCNYNSYLAALCIHARAPITQLINYGKPAYASVSSTQKPFHRGSPYTCFIIIYCTDDLIKFAKLLAR